MTRRDLAALLRTSVTDLNREIWYKELAITRRTEITGRGRKRKERNLAYPNPSTSLRRLHDRLAHLLNRIRQPHYVFSPRAGRTTRGNAAVHAGQRAFLQIDIKKFYPSTTRAMIRRGLVSAFGMHEDVAGLIGHLVTVDDRACFGSPVTPVLMTIVFREMFDRIAEECEARGLRFTLWVDDMTISGRHITPDFLNRLRQIVREYGHKTHKIGIGSADEAICITGIWLDGRQFEPPHAQRQRLRATLSDTRRAATSEAHDEAERAVLSTAGTIRHIAGASSGEGQRMANLAERVRQARRRRIAREAPLVPAAPSVHDMRTDIPF